MLNSGFEMKTTSTKNYRQAIEWLQKLLKKAKKTKLKEPTAMTLATVGDDGQPSVRTVLVKDADERGFVFYTNTNSLKGQQLAKHPKAALCFHWEPLDRQVTIEGEVEFVSTKEADDYWSTRPRNSQVGGWASLQSAPLSGWKELLLRIAKYEIEFAGKKVPRPPHWTGYRLVPTRIEFWKRGPFRIHKRTLYKKEGPTWTVTRLYP